MDNEKSTKENKNTNLERREVLKALGTLPVLGAFFASLWAKYRRDAIKQSALLKDLIKEKKAPAVVSKIGNHEKLRLGIIGFGGRGSHLVRGAGFATPGWTNRASENAKKNKLDKAFATFMEQEDLNTSLNGVCDLFDIRTAEGVEASKNEIRPGGKPQETAKKYRHYTDMLADDDIDAVIIATPDHWHARIIIEAAKAGKHVYCEKGLTRTFEEAVNVYDTVKETGITFQLGHQNRQVEANDKAKQIIDKGVLGPINMVELTTNRNSPWGAWVWDIHPKANRNTIDWNTFQEPVALKNRIPFGDEALRRFFRWRCWYDYGTGLSGDLLSHDYDTINQIMDIGIPKYASSTGGVYFYKDGRDVPDVWNATFEFPEKDLTVLYSATLSSNNARGNRIMGHDATMMMGGQSGGGSIHGFTVTPDYASTQYKKRIENGFLNTNYPMYSYAPGSKQIDGVTSATSKYFASKGLLYTYRDGKRVDPTHLHIKDWLDAIRTKSQPKCNIEVAFHEGVACAMATESYLQGRRIEWDPVNRRLI